MEYKIVNSKYFNSKVAEFNEIDIPEKSIIIVGNSIVNTINTSWFVKPVYKFGINGDFSSGVLKRIVYVVNKQPSKIILLIGINDLLAGKSAESVVENIKSIKSKVPYFIRLDVVSVLPVSFESGFFANKIKTQAEITKLNAYLQKLKGVNFINAYSFMADEHNNLKADYTTDGIHLTEKGYYCLLKIIENNTLD